MKPLLYLLITLCFTYDISSKSPHFSTRDDRKSDVRAIKLKREKQRIIMKSPKSSRLKAITEQASLKAAVPPDEHIETIM